MKTKKYIFYKLSIVILFGTCANQMFAQPNNNCASATVLTVGAACTNGTNVGSNVEVGEPPAGCWLTPPNNTVWYRFTTGAAGNYTVSTDNGGTTDTQLKILSGACGAFATVACSEDDGTTNTLAAVATAALAAATTYYVQVDVYNNGTGPFCINVAYNPPLANDCIFNAIDITALIDGVSLPLTPFNCRAPDVFSSALSPATRQDLSGDPNGCEICDLTCTTKNPDHRDVWYKFTVSAATPPTWLTVYNELPEPGTPPTFATGLYSGTPTGTCGVGLIGGMTQIDCSAGDILPICNSPAACIDGGGYGARNKAICTTPVRPRLDISGLAFGTYYFRVWDWGGGAPDAGSLVICAESVNTNPPTEDKCPTTNTIGCADGPPANAEFDSTYINLSNAGMTGNSCNTAPNEPQVAAGPTTDIQDPCFGGWSTGIGYVNNVMNNSAIYRFEVNALAPCVCRPDITLSNISYGGRAGFAAQVQVMNSPCAGGTNAVMAWSTTQSCLEMRMAGNGTIPNGIYYIVVDGQDGELVKYDLTLKLNYSGVGCTPLVTNICDVPLPVEWVAFTVEPNIDNDAMIWWSTASETNNRLFTIERSQDAIEFEPIQTVKGAGNSNTTLSYQTIDKDPLEETSYYRLKQTDYDGKSSYSKIVSYVNNKATKLMSIYPNPAHSLITIQLDGYLPSTQITITNLIGTSYYSEMVNSPDKKSVQVDVSTFPMGLYTAKIMLSNGNIIISKFLKE